MLRKPEDDLDLKNKIMANVIQQKKKAFQAVVEQERKDLAEKLKALADTTANLLEPAVKKRRKKPFFQRLKNWATSKKQHNFVDVLLSSALHFNKKIGNIRYSITMRQGSSKNINKKPKAQLAC